MAKPDKQHQAAEQPRDELIARFQLESERAIAAVRHDLTRQLQEQAHKVAQLEDQVVQMTEAAKRQTQALDDGLHHTRKAVEEVNEAMKVAAKAATEARDSAAVYEKLKESQPDFAGQVRALETRVAAVVDKQTHLDERLNRLAGKLDEFELVADEVEETRGEVSNLDMGLKRLDTQFRTARG